MTRISRTGFALLVRRSCWPAVACGKGASTGSRPASAEPALSERELLRSPPLGRPAVLWAWLNGFVDRGSADPRAGGAEGKGWAWAIILGRRQPGDPKRSSRPGPPFSARSPSASISHAIDRGRRRSASSSPVPSEQLNAGGRGSTRERQPAVLCRQARGPGTRPRPDDGPAPEGVTAHWKDVAVLAVPEGATAVDISTGWTPKAAWSGTPRRGRRGSCASSASNYGQTLECRARTPTA